MTLIDRGRRFLFVDANIFTRPMCWFIDILPVDMGGVTNRAGNDPGAAYRTRRDQPLGDMMARG